MSLTNELDAIKTRLLDTVRRRRRYARLGVIAGVGLAAASSIAAVAIIQATPEEISYSVICYETTSLDARTTTVVVPQSITTNDGQPVDRGDALDPRTACAAMWRMGILGQPQPLEIDPNEANFPIPPIAGCQQSNGIGVGFPINDGRAEEDVCSSLGMAIWG